MRLSSLLASFPDLRSQIGAHDPDLTAVVADSRRVTPGSLFVAVRGDNFDGHQFIPEAVARGAAAVVAEDSPLPAREGLGVKESIPNILVPDSRLALGWLSAAWHNFPSRNLILIGVTGTDGKTTTCNLIYSILMAAGLRAGLISTVGAVIGEETLDTGFHVTTPDAPEIQGYLARMVSAGLTHCVVEVTSHGLAQHRVTGCDFDIAVVTNITHEHLDYHQTYENYRAAKSLLFSGLSTAAPKPGVTKTGVLNLDDSSFDYLRSSLKERLLTYSLEAPQADVRAANVVHAPDGLHFQPLISNPPISNLQLPMTTSLVGEYNVSNCLAAIAATVGALGIPPEAAQQGIAALKGVPGRMERIDLGQPFTALVDFAHTPNALRRALETARQMITSDKRPEPNGAKRREARPERNRRVEGRTFAAPASSTSLHSAPGTGAPGRVIVVFGSAGLRDVEKRRMMAETAIELADLTVFTAEDPRTESLDDILEMMAFGARRKGGVEGQSFFRIPDRGEAIRFAVRLARPGDIVLACGKGHEQTMCFGETEYPWDDRIAMRAALAELLGVPGPEMPRLPTS